jgi:hypothetical protein
MGDMYDEQTADPFDSAGSEEAAPVRGKDPSRPDARRGRYYLPNPDNGKTVSWQRVTNFVKMTDDTYHLDLWKRRNTAKGVAILSRTRPTLIEDLAGRDVKVDKDWYNNVVSKADDAADAYRMAEEGTALHKSTELADFAGGDLNRVAERHRPRIRQYLDALAVNGLTVLPDMIERVTASQRYQVAGKFDRIFGLRDGSAVIGDLKTGDSLDLSFPSIAAQLEAYEDGINNTGIFNGRHYDTGLKVRTDFGIVVHLPSTRSEVTVYAVSLPLGREINEVNLRVRDVRRIGAKDVAKVFAVDSIALSPAELDAHWLEAMNAASTRAELVAVAERARSFGQWNERLAGQARVIDAELAVA